MKKITNTLICVLFAIALSGYGFCAFFLQPKMEMTYAAYNEKENAQFINIPSLMYHLVINNSQKAGEFVITPDEFEKDIIYLNNNGYTPVFVSEIWDFVNAKGTLPPKPVLITFDDGYYNNYLNVFPVAKKYNTKINIALIGKYTQQYSKSGETNELYTHLTYDHIREMAQSGLVEFGNHSYDLHKITTLRRGVQRAGLESDEDYTRVLNDDFLKIHNDIIENCGVEMKYFAYPYGFSSKEAEKVLKSMGYNVFLTCDKGKNMIKRQMGDKIEIKRYNRPSGKEIKNLLN